MKVKRFFSLLSPNGNSNNNNNTNESCNNGNDTPSSKASTGTATSSNNSFYHYPESVLHFISDPGDDISSIHADGSVTTNRSLKVDPKIHHKSRNELDQVTISSEESVRSRNSSKSRQKKGESHRRNDAPSVSPSASPSAQTSLGGFEVYTEGGVSIGGLASDVCVFSLCLMKHSSQKDRASPTARDVVEGLNRHIQLVSTETTNGNSSDNNSSGGGSGDQNARPQLPRTLRGAEIKAKNINEPKLVLEAADALVQASEFGRALELCKGLLLSSKTSTAKALPVATQRADVLSQISLLSLVLGDVKSAMKNVKEALQINRDESRTPELAVNLIVFGLLQYGRKKYYETLQLWREALQLKCLVYGYDHPYVAVLLNNLACLHYHEGDYSTSLSTFVESHDLNRGFLGSSSGNIDAILLNIASTKSNIAMLAARTGQMEWAANVLEEVLSLQSSIIPDPTHHVIETTKYTIDRLVERREFSPNNNADGSAKQLKLPLLSATSVASRTQGASDVAAIQSCNTFQPFYFEQTAPSIFGHGDGIPMRRLGAKSVVSAIDDTDVLNFLMFGPLLQEHTPKQRVRSTVLHWFGKTLQDDQNGKLTCVPFNGTPRKRIRIPVDVDGDAVVDAEFYLKGIGEQATDHLEHDETEEALELFKSVLASHVEKYGNVHHLVGTATHNIGLVHLYAQDYAQASFCFQEAVTVRGAALGEEHPAVAASLTFIGMIFMVQRDPESAIETFSRVLKLVRKAFGQDHIQAARALNNIAIAQYESGRRDDSFQTMKEANDILRQQLKASTSNASAPFNQRKTVELAVSNTLCNLAFLNCRKRNFKESFAGYQEASLIHRKHAGFRFSDVGYVEDNKRYVRANISDFELKVQLEGISQEQPERENTGESSNCLFDVDMIDDFKQILRC